MLRGALQWSVNPQQTGCIYRRLWQPLQSSPCMLVLILPTPEGWKAELTLVGKKVTQIFKPSTRPGIELGTWGLGGRDLNHCANPSLLDTALVFFWPLHVVGPFSYPLPSIHMTGIIMCTSTVCLFNINLCLHLFSSLFDSLQHVCLYDSMSDCQALCPYIFQHIKIFLPICLILLVCLSLCRLV